MSNKIWIVRPSEEHFVSDTKAHLAYKISDAHLLRGSIPADTYGGWMMLSNYESSEYPDSLISEILAECIRFSYKMVYFPMPISDSNGLFSFWHKLKTVLSRHGVLLLLPISLSNSFHDVSFCVSSAVSGGSLRIYLTDLISRYGAENLVLEHLLTRVKMTMPSPDGKGVTISEAELQSILAEPEIQPFYSPELCLNYFTYQANHNTQFILFDDARSLTAKYHLGCSLGINKHLFLFRELKNYYKAF